MNDLTFSGDGSINLESNVKELLTKIFILYAILSFAIFITLI